MGRYYRKWYGHYGYRRRRSYQSSFKSGVATSPVPVPIPAEAIRPAAPVLDEGQGLAGLNKDIRELFLSLDGSVLAAVFRAYKSIHGEKKTEYARRTYLRWKSGGNRPVP